MSQTSGVNASLYDNVRKTTVKPKPRKPKK